MTKSSTKHFLPNWSWASEDKTIADIETFILEALDFHKNDTPSEMYFSVVLKESNKFIGCLWFFDINWFVPSFELAYWLDTRETEKGCMREQYWSPFMGDSFRVIY